MFKIGSLVKVATIVECEDDEKSMEGYVGMTGRVIGLDPRTSSASRFLPYYIHVELSDENQLFFCEEELELVDVCPTCGRPL